MAKNWSVTVDELRYGRGVFGYQTVFQVEAQFFQLANVQPSPRTTSELREAREHCEFVRKMFLIALRKMEDR